MISCLIVDDEKKSRDLLNTMLSDYCQNVKVIGMAARVEESLELIARLRPQLVFLDIELSGKNAFDLLDILPNRRFEVIFTTGYEQYALKAFKYAGLDYLLKPIDLEELQSAIDRAGEKIVLLNDPEEEQDPDRLVVATHQGYMVLDPNRVVYLEAEGSYTQFYFEDGSKVLVCDSIGDHEKNLPTQGFVRIHRSHLVNLDFVQEYVRGRGGYVLLKNGNHLNVSIRKKTDLLKALGR